MKATVERMTINDINEIRRLHSNSYANACRTKIYSFKTFKYKYLHEKNRLLQITSVLF